MEKWKDEAKKVIDRLPDNAAFDDLIYELYVNHQIQTGLKQLKEGKIVSHEEVKKRLLQQ